MQVLLEESTNLKERVIRLTEDNNSLKNEKARLTLTAGAEFRELIERQKEEIRLLKAKVFEQSSTKGLQLLSVFNSANATDETNEGAS